MHSQTLTYVFWEILLQQPPVLLHIVLGVPRMQGPDWYLPRLFLRVTSAASNFWKKRQFLSHWGKAQACLVLAIKQQVPKLVFLSCNTMHCTFKHPSQLFVKLSWVLENKETDTNRLMDTYATYQAVLQSFVSYIGILCLLPTSMKP